MFRESNLNVSIIHNKVQNVNLINTIISDYYCSESCLQRKFHPLPTFSSLKSNIFGSYFSVNVGTKHINFYPSVSPKSTTGNTTYVNSVMKCDCVLFVCYDLNFNTDEYRFDKIIASMFLLFKKLNVRQLIVAIDNLPITNNSFNEEMYRFEAIKGLLINYCEKINFQPYLIEYVPISVSENRNILLHDNRSYEWFTRGSILKILQGCRSIKNTDMMNIRLLENIVGRDFDVIYGKLDKNKSELFTIDEKQVSYMNSKEFHIEVKTQDNVVRDFRRIFIPKNDLKNLYLWRELEVEIIILPHQKVSLKTNLSYIYKTLCGACVCVVTKIIKKFNLITGERLYNGCSELNRYEYGYVELKLGRPIYIELYQEYPLLGFLFLSINQEYLIGFIRNRKSIDSELKKHKDNFELCANPSSWPVNYGQIEHPNLQHLHCSIASKNKKAFLILSEKIIQSSLTPVEVLNILRSLPNTEKDQFLCILLKKQLNDEIIKVLIDYLCGYLLTQVNSYEFMFSFITKHWSPNLYFLSPQDFKTQLDQSHSNLVRFLRSKLITTLDGLKSKRSLLRQVLDPLDVNNFLKYGETFVKNPYETNAFLQIVYKFDDARFFDLILDECEVSKDDLIDKAIELKAENILKCFVRKDPYLCLRSTKRNKYLRLIESLNLSGHWKKFQRDFESNLKEQNFSGLLDSINRFALCILYNDEKINQDQEHILKELMKKSKKYPEAGQALDCLFNFLEANYKRNDYQFRMNQPIILMEKYLHLNVKVCLNYNCENTLLRIFNDSRTLQLARTCQNHKLVREFTIQDIKNRIDNRYIAKYIYYFYKLFKAGIEVINGCNHKPFLLNGFEEFTDNNHLKKILLNDADLVKNFLLFD